jgi:hypothetical protein
MTINRENFATWTAALRSGEYKQGTGLLKAKLNGETRHCCLGVACELAGLPSEVRGASLEYEFVDGGWRELAILPPSAQEWLGVEELHGIVFDAEHSLPSMNDAGMTFGELADMIDAWVADQPIGDEVSSGTLGGVVADQPEAS